MIPSNCRFFLIRMDEYVPRRHLTRRKLINASTAEQKFKKAVLEAAAELSHEFSEHYWKDVLQKGESDASSADQVNVPASTGESIKKGFLFYLNASGRYLVLREHLRTSISSMVQQKCLNMRPSGFHNHRDLQAYLHDMYVYLAGEMHEILNSSSLQETDPLNTSIDRLLQQTSCDKDEDLTKASLHLRHITELGIFAEEAFAQGDFESCHKLHLQRTCKDKESARCWTEFAIMWLSKGNNKMAEIAANEALNRDPLYLYALLIFGVICIRQGYATQGLECLTKALKLKQMAPEILVILGVASSLAGKEDDADSFFRKAAYVHRVITGRSTEGLDKIFAEKKAFNMKEFINEMDASASNPALTDAIPSTLQLGEDPSAIPGEESQPVKKKSKVGRKSSRLSKGDLAQNEMDTAENAAVKKKRKSSGRTSGASDGPPRPNSSSDVIVVESSSSLKKKKKSSGRNPARIEEEPAAPAPTPRFNQTLADILPDEVELPSLVPSILSPWDVTEYSEKMERHLQTLDYLEGNSPDSKRASNNANGGPYNVIPSDDGIAPDNQLKEEYDKLADRKGSKGSRNSKDEARRRSKKSSGATEGDIDKWLDDGERINAQTEKEAAVPEAEVPTKMTNRLGSELIWTANLLINLRLFDFVDGVLSKHLFFYGSRTIQFIYLRAVSLFLRQREAEAMRLIKEAIELDSTNSRFWSLEGHCHYNLNNTEEAMNSYEQALKLPHTNENRHLVYIRYGTLVLDRGKTKLAKRVFLHGVSKYPTPSMWLAVGSVCFQRKEYDQAESAFSEANRLDNTNPIAWGHLAICSLMQDKKELAEQAYKWAMRFGLKKGPLLEEIQKAQKAKGFGDPSFPHLPNCVPHDYFLRRLGKVKPFNLYKEGLNQGKPRFGKDRYADTDDELLMKTKLGQMAANKMHRLHQPDYNENEWDDEYEDYPYTARTPVTPQSVPRKGTDTPPDLLTLKDPPPLTPLNMR